MKQNTRDSDELLLIQFVEDQGFDIIELVEASERLKKCISEKLIDYSKPRTENDSDKKGE